MNEIIRNKYILEESKEDSITNSNDEIELNLKLTSSIINLKYSRITGSIFDEYGKSIYNSIIKLESIDKKFKAQAITNINGKYFFENIPENFYILSIWAENTIVQKSEKIQIVSSMIYNLNFTLKRIQDNTSIITGDVLDSITKKPIYNVNVLLFEILKNGEKVLKAISYTNNFGQFAFRKVLNGKYFLIFNMHGYIQYFSNISIINLSQISSLKINMILDKAKLNKIISGVILNKFGDPIEDTFVYLYLKTSKESKEKIVKVTKTNKDGIYVFTNIPKGSYRVEYLDENR